MCERYIDWLPPVHHQLGPGTTTQACALTGNQTGDPLVCRLALNPLSQASQGSTQEFIDLLGLRLSRVSLPDRITKRQL